MADGGEEQDGDYRRIMDTVLRKSGENVALLIDALVGHNMDNDGSVYFNSLLTVCSVLEPHPWAEEPLLVTVQEQLCQDDCACRPPLKILNRALSGSRAQCMSIEMGVSEEHSDFDIMWEYGPVRWLRDLSTTQPPAVQYKVAGMLVSMMQLRLEPTENAGFYLLRRRPSMQCQHTDWLPLAAGDIRRLMQVMAITGTNTGVEISGPAAVTSIEEGELGAVMQDNVACMRLPFWPDDEALHRLRRLAWLPAAAVSDIEHGGLHVVPVGCHGSPTEEIEWRLSFSRPEAITALHMATVHRRTFVALKICKLQLGNAGSAVKSYYLLTVLLWLSLAKPFAEWTNVTYGASCVLRQLQQAIAVRRLPCFFLSSVNVLRPETEHDWNQLAEAVAEMQRRFTPLVFSLFGRRFKRLFVHPIFEAENHILSAKCLKACLVRIIIVNGFNRFINTNIVTNFSKFIPALRLHVPQRHQACLKIYFSQLIKRLHSKPGAIFMNALLVAPSAVAARVRLQRTSHCTWTWHVQPLLELLNDRDLDVAFDFRREQLIHWCRQQWAQPVHLRAAEVPAEPRSLHGTVELLTRPATLMAFLNSTEPHTTAPDPAVKEYIRQKSRRATLECAPSVGALLSNCAMLLKMDEAMARRFGEAYAAHMARHWNAPDAREMCETCISTDSWQMDIYLFRLLQL